MTVLGADGLKRCFGGQLGKELYGHYHDHEWGKLCFDDQALFEALILEMLQSGLSFEIVLKKRAAFKEAFFAFDPSLCALVSDDYLESCLTNKNLIRHKKKIFSIRQNAKAFLSIQEEFLSFSQYLWSFVDFKTIRDEEFTLKTHDALSDQIAKDLKNKGMSFVGSKTIYAYMQAVGLRNDHAKECHLASFSSLQQR